MTASQSKIDARVTTEDGRDDLLKVLRRPLLSIVRALSQQQGLSAAGDRTSLHAETAQSVLCSNVPRPVSQAVLDQEELQAATHATLRAHAITDEAMTLVAKVAAMVEDHGISAGSRKNRRKGTAGQLEYATGAFLANLLRALSAEVPEPNGWVYRSMHAKSFTGRTVSYRTFTQLIEGLTALALIDHVAGHKVSDDRSDMYAARFRATPALLRLCVEYGVKPGATQDHFEFEYDLPKHPIELRARKVRSFYTNTKPPGRDMRVERTPKVEMNESWVRELNEFFAKQTLRGGSHEGYIRIFQNGDDPHFDWNMGGRLYSQHFSESYQVLSAAKRAAMTINGEPVAEIDIRASYLTIFLAMHDVQLDTEKDPYEIEGPEAPHRSAVKAWMVATFGNAKPIRRWPPKMLQKSPELKHYRVVTITERVLDKYPTLKTWGLPLNGRVRTWADLMWLESVVMVTTMRDLMGEAVPSLSVHDSLIVPASKASIAAQALAKRFHWVTQVQPLLKINQPAGSL